MSLRELLKNYNLKTGISELKTLPEFSALLREERKTIKNKFDQFEEIILDPKTLEQSINEIISHFENGDITNLSPSLKKNIPECLWFADKPLVNYSNIINQYFEEIINYPSKRVLRRLVMQYFSEYKPDDNVFKQLAITLSQLVEKTNDQTLKYLKEKFSLFSLNEDTKKVANLLISSTYDYENFLLEEFQIANQTVMQSKFMEEVFKLTVLEFKNHSNKKYIDKLISCLKFDEVYNFQNQIPFFIDSLLEPWANQNPSQEVKDFLIEYLIEEYGDLRNTGEDQHWFHVKENNKRIFRKWLAGVQIQYFMQIISNVANINQWQYRKKFWMSYYESNHITDAYIILGKDAVNFIENQRIDDNVVNFGTFSSGSRVQRSHSVLLLEIGDLVIADWSHDGACRIWDKNNDNHPNLFQSEYTRNELVDNVSFDPINHAGAVRGYWQTRLSSQIQYNTGIRISHNKFMPTEEELL